MRLIAIRGCNLASLAGEFEVNLEREPLGSVGLFAITGPTGSGKSTILDAMCLALYGKTPRLSDRGGVRVGGNEDERQESVSSNDARSLLRRGAKEAWAEVEFVGSDGQRYVSRWSVRRARNKATGRPQEQSMELRRQSDGARLGGKLSETRTEIEARVGLTYDQFRRSVLLAQGDFAAFLKAGADDRASLLEKMTQTERYGEISKMVYRRASEEADKLNRLCEARKGLGIRSPEERALLEEALQQARSALREQQVRLEALQADGRWYVQLDKLQQQTLEGQQALAACQMAWELDAPNRLALEWLLQLRQLRPLVDSSDKAATTHQQCLRELELAGQSHQQCAVSLSTAREALKAAEESHKKAAAAIEEAKPALDQARVLDGHIGQARKRLEDSFRTAQQAQEAERKATTAAASVRKQIQTAQAEAQRATAWLSEHAADAPLAAQWAQVDTALGRLRVLRQDAEGLSTAGAALEAEQARRTTLVANSTGRWKQASAALAAARQAMEQAEGLRPSQPREALLARCEMLEEQHQGLLRGLELSRTGTALAQQTIDSAAERQALQAEVDAGRLEGDKQSRAAALSEGRLEEAQRLELEASRAADLASHRATLEEGHPCPLCGSLAHPWATGGDASGELDARRKRRQQLQTELKSAQAEAVKAGNRLASLLARQEERSREAAKLGQAREENARLWSEWLSWSLKQGLGTPATEAALAQEAVQTLTEGVRTALEQAKSDLAAWERYRVALDKARIETDRAAGAEREALSKVDQAKESLAEQERALADHRTRTTQVAAALGEVTGPLESLLPPEQQAWKRATSAELERFAKALAHIVQSWEEKSSLLRKNQETLAALALEEVRCEEVLRQAQAEVVRVQKVVDEQQAECASLDEQRRCLFQGDPVLLVETRLSQELVWAESAWRHRQAEAQTAEKALSAAAARVEEVERKVQQAGNELAASNRELQQALDSRLVSLEQVREALSQEAEAVQSRVAAVQQQQQLLEKWRTVVEERVRAMEAHAQASKPSLSREELATLTSEITVAIEPLQRQEEEARLALRRDDEARGQALDLEQQVAAQQAAYAPWGRLNDCIGSADGKKFRRFAQGLTLDSLLAHANRHLQELAPRYRLLRVPGEELELQILDRDMGDEVRTINSLSGGETFLASLALALGLASLASRKTLVESLFIDEGFGTLDPETLESALGVLDGLQATGRKVGIISHVPGLALHIGARVEVQRQGQGRSAVVTLGPQQ